MIARSSIVKKISSSSTSAVRLVNATCFTRFVWLFCSSKWCYIKEMRKMKGSRILSKKFFFSKWKLIRDEALSWKTRLQKTFEFIYLYIYIPLNSEKVQRLNAFIICNNNTNWSNTNELVFNES